MKNLDINSLTCVILFFIPLKLFGFGQREFVSPDGSCAIVSEKLDDGTSRVVLKAKGKNGLAVAMGDGVTKLQLEVFWCPDSLKYLEDSWFGSKGRWLALYIKSGDSYVPLPIIERDGSSLSDFVRDVMFVGWNEDLKGFRLIEFCAPVDERVEIRHFDCFIGKDAVEAVLVNTERVEEKKALEKGEGIKGCPSSVKGALKQRC
jgi:hypothetical protein